MSSSTCTTSSSFKVTMKRIAILLPLFFFGAVCGFSSPAGGRNESEVGEANSNQGDSFYKLLYTEEDEIDEILSRTTPRRLGARFRTFFFEAWLRIRNSVRARGNGMTAQERKIVQAYKKTLPAVAEIMVYKSLEDSDGRVDEEELQEGQVRVAVDTVSGFLWDDQGHIVTNEHCLYGNVTKDSVDIVAVKVRFLGMEDYLDAEMVGSDPIHDLAVLKVSSKQYNPKLSDPLKLLPNPIPKGSSHSLEIGQSCLALGVPSGRSDSLTVGVVSSLNRLVNVEGGSEKFYCGCIQTDALLGPGNSGGPLLDTRGRLIGINFGGEEMRRFGFSIAVDTAKRVVGQIVENGYSASAVTGIDFTSDDLQKELELGKGSGFGGVLIKTVLRKSPADDAGLQGSVVLDTPDGMLLEPRDVVIGVDGKRVTSADEFFGILDSKLPGQTALITVSRVARIRDFERWTEVIPIKLITLDELCHVSEEARAIIGIDNEEGSYD